MNQPNVTYNHEYERKLKACFIGAGGHSFRNVYPTFQYAPIELAAICDVDGNKAAAYARQFGAAKSYTDAVMEGKLFLLNDGNSEAAENSWNGERKAEDWWGYTWSHAFNVNKVVYSAGETYASRGGWFDNMRVQVRQNFKWVDVDSLQMTPNYPANADAGSGQTYTITFEKNVGGWRKNHR